MRSPLVRRIAVLSRRSFPSKGYTAYRMSEGTTMPETSRPAACDAARPQAPGHSSDARPSGPDDRLDLEQRVRERTAELRAINDRLRAEIAEKERAQDALREACETLRQREENFRRLVEHAADCVYVHGMDGRFNLVNQNACNTLGYSREELLEMHPWQIVADSRTREQMLAQWAAQPAGSAWTIDSTHRRKDGSTFPVELRACRLANPGGDMIVAVARDVTDRKKAESVLRDEVAERKRASEISRGQTAALVRTLSGLAADPSLDAYLGKVLKALAEQLGERSGAIWLHDLTTSTTRLHLDYDDGRIMIPAQTAHPGISPHAPHAPSQAPGTFAREPYVFHDAQHNPALADYRDYFVARGIQSILTVPMFFGDEPVGSFTVRSTRRRTFTSDQIELAQALAHQACLAVQLTRLAEKARQAAVAGERTRAAQERAAELGRVNEALEAANAALEAEVVQRKKAEELSRGQTAAISQTLSFLAAEPDLDGFLGHVLEAVIQQLGGMSGALWFHNSEAGTVTLKMEYSSGRIRPAEQTTHPAATQVFRASEIFEMYDPHRKIQSLVYDVDHPGPKVPQILLTFLRSIGVKHVLTVPMVLGDETIGWFTVRSRCVKDCGFEENIGLAEALVRQATLAVQIARLGDQASRSAVLEERNRMAREIHDTLAQGFTGIIVQLQGAKQTLAGRAEQVSEAVPHVDEALSLARENLAEARRSVWALRPQALEGGDLAEALKGLAARSSGQVVVKFRLRGGRVALPPEVEINLLRVAQEALANALHHAEARHVRIELVFGRRRVGVLVSDDGRGFDAAAPHAGGFGMISMRERAAQLGGGLAVASRRGRGTRVLATAPLPPAAA